MADLPERIWARPDNKTWALTEIKSKAGAAFPYCSAQYVRADIYAKELPQLAIESKDRELALARLVAEVLAIGDRVRFLEKALDQAERMTAMRMYCIVGNEKNFMLSEKRHCIHKDDYPELAQYLKEKAEQ